MNGICHASQPRAELAQSPFPGFLFFTTPKARTRARKAYDSSHSQCRYRAFFWLVKFVLFLDLQVPPRSGTHRTPQRKFADERESGHNLRNTVELLVLA